MSHPLDNLVLECSVRSAFRDATAEEPPTLYGHFAVFNQWTEINSLWEGRFMERIAPGAFADTFRRRRDQLRVMFEHGHDVSIGNKPLGTIRTLREDKVGAFYEVDPIDRPYVDDVTAMARAGVLGASFRFKILDERWTRSPDPSADNPEGLDERTVQMADVFEFGPVVWGAYDGATAMMRSGTDKFRERLANDPLFVARFAERAPTAYEDLLRTLPRPAPDAEPPEPADRAAPAVDDEAAVPGAETFPSEAARRQWWWAQRLQRI